MREPSSTNARRGLFRQMRWVYVYLPPMLLVLTAVVASFLIALSTSSVASGIGFEARWIAAFFIILAATASIILFNRRFDR